MLTARCEKKIRNIFASYQREPGRLKWEDGCGEAGDTSNDVASDSSLP